MINLSVMHALEWNIEESHEILREPSNTLGEDNKILTSVVAEGMKEKSHKAFGGADG